MANKYNFLASIDVDSQKCFTPICKDELPVPEGDQIAHELNLQAKYSKLRVGSKDAHSPEALWVASNKEQVFKPIEAKEGDDIEYKNIDKYWPIHAVPGTRGFELLDSLPKPSDYDFFVWKGVELDMHPYGACYHDLAEKMSTGLIEYLHSNNITHIVVGGLSLDFCVKTTVLQLLKAKFKVIVNLSATRGIDPDLIKLAKTEMTEQGAVIIENSNELSNIKI